MRSRCRYDLACRFSPIFAVLFGLVGSSARADNAGDLKFFEMKIRPVLVEKCYSCHSAESKILRGALLVDSRAGLLKGGDTGPAIVPGKPEESLLIKALKYDGFEMPPTGKLSDAVIADFEIWIKRGAADPRSGAAVVKKTGMDLETGRKFWSFRPVEDPQLPEVKNAAWPIDPLDRFILAKLEANKLQPNAEADATTLVRRLYFDLVGLPPTVDEVTDFVRAENKAEAYAALVDRLLASPQFAERWGRHWLDVARFAESSGGGRSMFFKEAWRYRDYVLQSFHEDKPFDQFVVEQIAGDLLSAKNDAEKERNLVATAYLILGANNYEEQDKRALEFDVIDEQIETVGKGLLGMTLGCARCHDHKFDPIPMADYYGLAGIFRSTHVLNHENVSSWVEAKLPMTPEQTAAVAAHDKEVAELKKRIDAAKKAESRDSLATAKKGRIEIDSLPGIVIDDPAAKKIGKWTNSSHTPTYVGDGYLHDANEGKGEKTLTFQPEFKKRGLYEVRLAYVPGNSRSTAVPIEILSADGEASQKIDMKSTPPIEGRFVSLGRFNFDETNQWFVMVSNEGTTGHVAVDCVQFLPVDDKATLAQKSEKSDDQSGDAATAVAKKVDKKEKRQDVVDVASLESQMKKLKAAAPLLPRAMAAEDADEIADCPLCMRGNPHAFGKVVPRGVLQVASYGNAPEMPKDASGREELARWVVDPKNPLTARVYVNRIWHHLFGVGLVRTVDNFGTTGETPSHPELLDHLATRFVRGGWSTKRLVREIVLSQSYRLSSAAHAAAAKVDPDNRLLAHANRKRLDAEALRDAMLTVSGKLDKKFGGPNVGDPSVISGAGTVTPTEYGYVFTDFRRSVYTPAFRNRVLELFEAFDMADQNTVSGRRNVSTVAPQALYMLNAPFVMQQAKFAAERAAAWPEADDAAKVERAFREALGRAPTSGERRIALASLEATPVVARKEESSDPKSAAWERLFQALFGCLDFRYVD